MSNILARNRSKPADSLQVIYDLEQLCYDIRSITGNNKKIATRQYTIRERLVNSVQNAYAYARRANDIRIKDSITMEERLRLESLALEQLMILASDFRTLFTNLEKKDKSNKWYFDISDKIARCYIMCESWYNSDINKRNKYLNDQLFTNCINNAEIIENNITYKSNCVIIRDISKNKVSNKLMSAICR